MTAKQYRRPRRPMRISDHARGQMLTPVTDTRRTPFTPAAPPPGVGDGRALMAMDDCPAYSWALQSEISEGLFFPGYPYLAELTQRPEYRRITEILAKDMTRRWVTVTATGDEKSDRVAAVTEAMRKFGIQEIFQKAAELDGFFGRGHIYVDTGATDNPAELETPLFLDKRKVKPGSVLGFRTVEPMWTYPNTYNSSDPLNPTYYKPVSWLVMGKTVHRSRLLTFVSRPVPDILKAAYSFGGLSMSQLAKPYVDNWIRTRQSVSDLVSNYSKDVIKTNLGQVLNAGAADALLARAELYTRTRDNRGLTMVDFETEDFVNVSTPLSSLDKLQAQSQEQMASVAGIPLVVLLGITPSGLNASSDGEIKTYYAWIASQQEAFMSAPLKYIMDLIQLNEFGDIDDTIVANWNSLWEDDDTTTATIRKTNADTDLVYVDGGVLSPEEVRERLAADRDSPYHGIDVTDVPEPPEPDLPDDGGEEADPFATDAGGEHWITVHPNGKEDKGQPLLVQSGEGGTVTVKGGAGGKLNGRTLTPGSMSKARSGGGESGGGGGQSEPDKPKEPERPAHEAKQAAAHALTEKADKENTEAAHTAAHEAHHAAMREAKERKDGQAALNHAILSQHHLQQAFKAKGREAKMAFGESDLAQRIKQAEKRFEKASVDDLSRHFKDSYGIEFANGSNAVRDYDKARKEHFKGWGQLTPEQKQARFVELNRLELAANAHTRVKGHTSYDLNENTPATKAARRTMAHVADAFDRLQSQGYDLKSAMSGAKVAFTPGNTGKAMGHAWQKNGVGYFAISSGKANNDMRVRLREATEQRAAKGLPRWSVSSSSDDVNTQMTAVHELAHALGMQAHIDSPGKLRTILGTMFNGSMAEQHKWIRENISEYAATNIKETDAELAALVTSPGYVRGTLPKALEDHVDALFHRKS